MWHIRQVKARGIFGFKANYLRTVIVTIIALIGGTLGGGYSLILEYNNLDESLGFSNRMLLSMVDTMLPIGGGIIVLLLAFFILNPLDVGTKRFFYRNLSEKCEMKEICFGFDRNYRNSVVIMLLRDIYLTLWTFLFIIPGIIKYYEYRMIPYILGDHPELSKEEAFALSKYLMDGNKWHAFCLDLSFIGWDILSAITFGILGVFYVNPYRESTNAALYEALVLIKRPYHVAEEE